MGRVRWDQHVSAQAGGLCLTARQRQAFPVVARCGKRPLLIRFGLTSRVFPVCEWVTEHECTTNTVCQDGSDRGEWWLCWVHPGPLPMLQIERR